jgi:hypothetical protein
VPGPSNANAPRNANSNQLPNDKYYKASVGLGQIGQQIHDVQSGNRKTGDAGLAWTPIGDVGTAVKVGYRTPVRLYNSTGAVIFVSFGLYGMAAPSTAANGMPVLAGSMIVYNSGYNNYVRSSGAGLFGYTGDPENIQIAATNPNEVNGTADSENIANVPTGPATLAFTPPGR